MLLPSVQRYHRGPATDPQSHDGVSLSLGATLAEAPDNSTDIALVPVCGDEEEESGDDSDISSLDEEIAASFVRKVVLAPPLAVAGVSAAIGSELGSPGIKANALLAETSPQQKQKRAPRAPGMGRHGRLKKGRRPADPYGCEIAADAANRSWHRAEVAAVVVGGAETVR